MLSSPHLGAGSPASAEELITMNQVPACTISSNNYLALTRVLVESFKEHNPDAEVYVCIVDRPDPSLDYSRMPFTAVFAEELGIPDFRHFAFRYDILELNTAVKPYLLTYLRDRHDLDRIFYFDPDIMIHDRLSRLEEVLDRHLAVMTPHITEPLDNKGRPAERFIRACGVYNLGFLGIRFNDQTAGFLDWWTERLNRYCFADLANGIFVDQSWMAFAPAYLESVAVVRDPIYNIAYWNLPHRRPVQVGDHWQVAGQRVGFFHFSGLDLANLDAISRHQDRIDLKSRPELRPLFESYRDRVLAAGHEKLRNLTYFYSTFDNGVQIPRLARLTLRATDPECRRWSDPFAASGDDSYFSWLCEPVELANGCLTRAALFQWEERSDLIAAFPDVCGGDLPAYVSWLQSGGGAGLHPVFLVNLRKPAGSEGVQGRIEKRLPADCTLSFGQEQAVLDSVDLGQPGSMTSWLNQPVTSSGPLLTRLAFLLHRTQPMLQESYPDPLGQDQEKLAYWFVLFGPQNHGLHPDLVRPVLRTLRLKSRLGIYLRGVVERFQASRQSEAADLATRPASDLPLHTPAMDEQGDEPNGDRVAPGDQPPAPIIAKRIALARGVNLVCPKLRGALTSQLASGISAALQHATVDAAEIMIDLTIPTSVVHNEIRQRTGAPYPVTLIFSDLTLAPTIVKGLPLTTRAGTYKIAYWTWDLAHLPLVFTDHFSLFDEVWAPSTYTARALRSIASVPVKVVPPCVAVPEQGDTGREELGLDRDRFYFLATFDAGDHPQRMNPSAAITAIRRVAKESSQPVGLALQITNADRDPTLIGNLVSEAEGAPVTIFTDDDWQAVLPGRLAGCDAYLSLHRCEGLGVPLISSMMLGKPVIATGYGGVCDYLDESTGFPVPFEMTRISGNYGHYPRGAAWAEVDVMAAVNLMLSVIEGPAEAAARAEAGRRKVEESYSVGAAAGRLSNEMTRVLVQLES
jgi:glycosyltransferase involved in cell wall biosynthesis